MEVEMEENLELNLFDEEYVRSGGFWERFTAYILDVFLIIGGVSAILSFFLKPSSYFFQFLIGIVYFTYFYGTSGETIGKKIMGLKVVTLDGSPLTYGKGFLRYIGYFLSTITLNIGFLMIAWDKKKQGLHDKICKTTVVAKERKVRDKDLPQRIKEVIEEYKRKR